jgi:Domain of unknown function (DUF4396)
MPPAWLQSISAIYVPLSIASAILVIADIFLLGRRQNMLVMEAAWPLTILYWGPIGLLFYFWFGRSRFAGRGGKHAETPMWQASFNSAAHCGAGCALGDFIGTWIVFATGVTLFGSKMGSNYLITFVLAYAFGVVFQYFAVAPMRGLDLRRGLIVAIKIDTLSLLAYQIGMFAFMGFQSWVYPDQQPTSLSFWLLMQIAMVLGFATTYPVNWWLIRRGIKEKM